MAKISKRGLVAIKQEATQGTNIAAAATDFLWAENPTFALDVDIIERNYQRQYLDSLPHFTGKEVCTVTFDTELKWSGSGASASSVPYAPLSAAIVACGASGWYEGGNVIFRPSSSAASVNYAGPGKSVSLEVYKDDIKHVVRGALGTFKIIAQAGQLPKLSFTFKGLVQEQAGEVAADVVLPTSTVNQINPPMVELCTLSMQGYTPVAAKLEFDAGVSMVERADISSSGGLLGFQITDIASKGSTDPEASTVAAHNFFSRFRNGTTGTLSAVIGNTVANTVTLSAAAVQYEKVSYGDRNGLLTFDVPLKFGTYNGNDSWTIKIS